MHRSIVAESDSESDGHHNSRYPPGKRVIQPYYFFVEEDLDDKDVKVDALHQLPGEGAEEEVVKEGSNGGADGIMARHKGTVHTHQEQSLRETQCYRKLTVDPVELFRLQPAE